MSFRSILRNLYNSLWDLALSSMALCLGAMMLLYPFGRDQGLYHYVGREWLRGSVPYRDLMEQKSPLVFLLYGLASAALGEHFWSYRVLELAFVLALGAVLAFTITPRAERPTQGLIGASVFAFTLTYVGYLNFWQSGQCELWSTGLSLCALCVIERRAPDRRPMLLAGALTALAVAAKPTAIAFIPVLAVSLVEYAQRPFTERRPRLDAALKSLGWYALGGALVTAVTLAYFTAYSALDDMYDMLVRCNRYYVEHESTVRSPGDMARQVKEFALASLPLLDVVVAGLTAALAVGVLKRSHARRTAVLTLAFGLCAVAGVCAQRKFFVYHWGAVLPVMSLGFLCGADTLARTVSTRVAKPWSAALTVAVLTALYAASFWSTRTVSDDWRRRVDSSWRYARGAMTRAEFLERTTVAGYDLRAQEEIGRWIESHSDEDDRVAMRNFEPAMYLTSHRSAGLRFFWTPWIAWPQRAYRRDQWLPQDQDQIRAVSPRYVVAVEAQREGVEAPSHYTPDYEPRFSHGGFVVMEYTNTHLDRDGWGAHDHGRPLRVIRALGVFEHPVSGLDGWEVEGEAMRAQPRGGAVGIQSSVTGFQGDALLNSFDPVAGDAAMGLARFPAFTAPAGVWLGMLIGGGMSDDTSVVLTANGAMVASWQGEDTEHLRWVIHDLTPYVGRTLQLTVNDRSAGAWGHIMLDHVVLLR